jgi:hypothetical protein
MQRPPVKNLPASVRQRLLNDARSHQRAFDEILQYYAIERFLYRLAQSPYGTRFILKGALIFTAWGTPLSRPTRDVDLMGFAGNTVDSLTAIFKEICAQSVDADGLLFDAGTVAGEPIKAQTGYAGVRISCWRTSTGHGSRCNSMSALPTRCCPGRGCSITRHCSTCPRLDCAAIHAKRSWPRSCTR